jgi:tRNA C32,U32 (ribose-2'-O)-methylase TrmJ
VCTAVALASYEPITACRAAKDNQKEQEALMALGAQLVALVEAFDRVLEDERAMSAAAESFGSLLEVRAACRRGADLPAPPGWGLLLQEAH